MTVNELRIGNIVQIKNKQAREAACSLDVYVRGVSDNDMWGDTVLVQNACNENVYEALIKNIAPIELTEDVLLKCGFKSVSGDAMVHKINRHFRLEYALGEYVLRIKTDRHDSSYVRVVRSLHQLQNLYFAITGEELDVDLCSK